MELGGNIELNGFSQFSRGEMVIIKKLVGNYARKFADSVEGVESVKLSTKPVHQAHGEGQYEIHGSVIIKGKVVNSNETNHNLFFAIDRVLKKIDTQLGKE